MQRAHMIRAGFAAAILACTLAIGTVAAAEGGRPATSAESPAAANGVVNLNTATEDELVRLPGIGPKKAQAIVALRDRMKGFKRLEAIMRVKGIGRATFRKLRPLLTLKGKTTLHAPAPRTRPAG